jgi:serine-type D-Ala-D-Ala carboxypeptidase/endopeptidase (penicillin-binding protein 4)
MRRWRWAAAPLGVAALAALLSTGGQVPPAGAETTTTAPSPDLLQGTSVLSPRRVPEWLDTTVATQRLDRAITTAAGPALIDPALIDPAEAAQSGPVGCVLVTQGSRVLFSLNPTTPFEPASNLKVLTATAALDRLGPSFRFTTRVMASAAPVNGVVRGNLYLVGGGDPLLRTAAYASSVYPPEALYTSINQLALQVKQAGVSVITGSVVGVESRYDSARSVATWKASYISDDDVGPLTALEVNDSFEPNPAAAAGAPAPPGGAAAALVSDTSAVLTLPSSNPPVSAATVFAALLTTEGIRIGGGATSGNVPPSAPEVTSIQSAPLSQEVDAMLTVSDDTAAELFTKELGYQVDGTGTTAAGTAVIRSDLAADGLPVSQLVNLDGSGLDAGDRATCTLMVDALSRAGPTGTIAAGLPVAGKTGTLASRLTGTSAVGRLRAKTGTLDGVSSLSGFVTPVSPSQPVPALAQPLVFSVIVNRIAGGDEQAEVDRIGVSLASFPEAVPLSQLEPRP